MGSFSSAGGNLSSDATCIAVPAAGDRLNTSPLLGDLRNNGGTVATLELRGGSPAIDSGLAAFCPGTDPRGITRPLDGNGDGTAACDSGAFELLDRNGNGVDDTAEIANNFVTDCNGNGNPDSIDSPGTDGDGIFDICDTCTDTDGDGSGDDLRAPRAPTPDELPAHGKNTAMLPKVRAARSTMIREPGGHRPIATLALAGPGRRRPGGYVCFRASGEYVRAQ